MFKMRKVSLLARVVSLVLCCFGDDDASGLLMVDMLLFKLDKLSILILLVSFPLSELNWLSSDMIDVYSTVLWFGVLHTLHSQAIDVFASLK